MAILSHASQAIEGGRKPRADHAHLIAICTPDFAKAALPHIPAHRIEMTRMIMLANIKSNRVTGLIAHHKPQNIPIWLTGYAQNIAGFLHTEYAAWSRYRKNPQDPELVGLLTHFAQGFAANEKIWTEVLNCAYSEVYNKINAAYPFDVSLRDWLFCITKRAHLDWVKKNRAAKLGQPDSKREMYWDEEEDTAQSCDFENSPHEWGNRIDLMLSLKTLKPRDYAMVLEKVNGKTNLQLAEKYKISEKTVVNTIRNIGLYLGLVSKRQ
jgi:DNA-binding CsgD family transcriptional regulator